MCPCLRRLNITWSDSYIFILSLWTLSEKKINVIWTKDERRPNERWTSTERNINVLRTKDERRSHVRWMSSELKMNVIWTWPLEYIHVYQTPGIVDYVTALANNQWTNITLNALAVSRSISGVTVDIVIMFPNMFSTLLVWQSNSWQLFTNDKLTAGVIVEKSETLDKLTTIAKRTIKCCNDS